MWTSDEVALLAALGDTRGSNRYLADSYYWATWENVYMFKRGIEEAKWKTKADNARLIRALENMKMEEGIEFPQGPKVLLEKVPDLF